MRAILGALLGAIVSGTLWYLVITITGYEVGYLALGIVFLIGIGSKSMGGEGILNALSCSAIAIMTVLISGYFVVCHYFNSNPEFAAEGLSPYFPAYIDYIYFTFNDDIFYSYLWLALAAITAFKIALQNDSGADSSAELGVEESQLIEN